MKAIVLKQLGSVENLMLREVSLPVMADHEVLVKVKAISINPIDTTVRKNKQVFERIVGTDCCAGTVILGWDISGVVTQVGKSVRAFKAGDEVFGMVKFPGNGKAYAQYVAAPEEHLVRKPSLVSHEAAAAASLAALTAYQSLSHFGALQKGQRVLIHGASGGVGHYAVQLARHFGAYIIASASAANKEWVLSLGADEFIDYQSVRFEEVVQEVDLVIDSVMRTTEHIERSLRVIRRGGVLISLAAYFDDVFEQKLEAKEVRGVRLLVHPDKAQLTAIASLLEQQILRSHISHRFSFEAIPQAHLQIETGKTVGKVVVIL